MEDYTVFESGGVVTLVVSVMEGNIRTSIIVSLSTINGSALGEFTGLTGVQKARLVSRMTIKYLQSRVYLFHRHCSETFNALG